MEDRIKGSRRRPAPVLSAGDPATGRAHRVLLGLDPSLRRTGYGLISQHRRQPVALSYGAIACPAHWQRTRCLVHIAQTLRQLIRLHHPTVCVVEGLFYAQNQQTTLIMGEARGAALAVAAEAGLEVFEIAPRKVKQAIVGYGAAQKLAVAKMVQRMLQLAEVPEPDAADGLALALTQALENSQPGLRSAKRI